MNLTEQMTQLARQARAASRELAKLTTREKNECLLAMADALEKNSGALKEANALDVDAAVNHGLSSAMLDRLMLDEKRVAAMAKGLRDVAALPDPVGRMLDERIRPNGLKLQKISTPIGVVVIIYESRPNVTADAASLCFKSGNATILRGGKEAMNSNQLIARTMIEAGKKALAGFPENAIQVVPVTDREAIPVLLSLTQYIDLCMPRGGEGLIRAVAECSKVPVIKHYKGVCHVYVDADADLKMAEAIALNAKVQRPAVCNAMETLLVDKAVAENFLPVIGQKLFEKHVEIRADDLSRGILNSKLKIENAKLKAAAEQDWFTEYNDYILNVRVVDGVQTGDRPHQLLRFGALGQHRHEERGACEAVPERSGFGHGLLERLDAVYRRRRIRHGRGNRHQHRQDRRARPDGPGGIDQLQVDRPRQRTGACLSSSFIGIKDAHLVSLDVTYPSRYENDFAGRRRISSCSHF